MFHIDDEGAVNFELLYRQLGQVAQGRIAHAEIVDGKRHPGCLQLFHLGDGILDVLGGRAFGQFECQRAARYHRHTQGLDHVLHEAWRTELALTHIHRQVMARRDPGRVPACQRCQRFLDRPQTELIDESGFFRNRDESRRRHIAQYRMVPAHQRFGSDQIALGIDLRLIVQAQFAAIDRIA